MMHSGRYTKYLVLFGIVIILLVTSSTAVATTAQTVDPNRIYGCVGGTSTANLKLGGRSMPPGSIVRIRDANGSCNQGETALDWNITGPKGDPTYLRTVVVSPTGTDTQNGVALLTALANITTATSTNRYLLKLEPGQYNIGSTSLNLKPYVDIEGSGELTTVISASVGMTAPSESELRFLSIAISSAGPIDAISVPSGTTNFRLFKTSLSVSSISGGVLVRGFVNAGSSTITYSSISASNGNLVVGIYNSGTITMSDSTLSVLLSTTDRRSFISDGDSTITNSRLTTSGGGYSIQKAQGTVKVANTLLDSSVSGAINCVAAYNANFVPLNNSCA